MSFPSRLDTLGRVWKTVYASGVREEKSFDALSRPVGIVLKSASGTVLRSESLTYLKSSQIDTRTVDGVATDYGYDSAGRLTSEVRPGYNASYAWDANSNRTSRTVNGVTQTATYDDGDKLLSVSQGGSVIRSYAYDGAGRVTSVTSGGVTTGLSWNARGYVGQVGSQTYTINGEGARVKESGQNILRSGTDVLAPVIADGNATYTPGVSERRSGATTYLHGGMKSVETQTNASQAVTSSKVFDAFGAELSTTGTWQGPSGYGGAFGYREDASQFKLLGHRLYDPVAGRFLSRDPIRDGRNWYAYCEGDPVNGADPTGLSVMDWFKEKWAYVKDVVKGETDDFIDDVVKPWLPIGPAKLAAWPIMAAIDLLANTVDTTHPKPGDADTDIEFPSGVPP